jgi:hypothetical protein
MSTQDGDILKLTMEVTLNDGTIAQNVFYFECEFAAGQADGTVLNTLETWIETAYTNLTDELVSTITQNLCTVQEIEWNATESAWEVTRLVGYFTPTITFGNSGEALPNQASAFATYQTARPKSRGRKFLFPFGETTQNGTYLISTALNAMADFADDTLLDATIGPLNDMVPGVPRIGVANFLQYTGAVVTNVLGTQRRRRPGVGA